MEALEHLFHHRSVPRGSLGSKDDLHSEVAACILEPDDIAGLVGARDVGPVQGAQVERPGSRRKCMGIEQSGVGGGTGLQHPQQDTIRRHGAQRTHRRTRVVRVDRKWPRTYREDGIRVGELAYRIRLGRPASWNGHREVVDLVDIGQPSGPSRAGDDQATTARLGYGRGLGRWRVVEGALLVAVAAASVVLGLDGGGSPREITRPATRSVTAAMAIAAARQSLACASTCHLSGTVSGTVHPFQRGHRDPNHSQSERPCRLQRVSWNTYVPVRGGQADSRAASVQEASGAGGSRTSQRGGRIPASVTVTSRRTAAVDGRVLAAARACRQ
jgi:hypothetical protein